MTEHQNIMAELREFLSRAIKEAELITKDRPEYGAEVKIAVRKMQETRMWLGVAYAMTMGGKPFEHKQEGE